MHALNVLLLVTQHPHRVDKAIWWNKKTH